MGLMRDTSCFAPACCRCSDALFAIDFVVSSHGSAVLIEAGTNVHKTASSKEKKTVLLPLVALGKLFRSDSWAEKWFSLRQACVPKSVRFVLPAYSEQSGRWPNRAMTTAEGILWMQDIMSWKCTTGGSLTIHSLKATLLKRATMSNSMDTQQSRILGHRVDPGSSSPLTYGRDNVAATQAQVAAMLQRIKAGRFDPDETRLAFVDRQIASFCAEIDKSDERLQYGDLDAVNASDVEDADEAEAEAHESKTALRIFLPEAASDSRIMQRLVSGTLHVKGLEDRFMCGRFISVGYQFPPGDLVREWPLCQQCSRTYLAMFDMSMQAREICSSQPAVVHVSGWFNLFFFQRARGLWPVLCRFEGNSSLVSMFEKVSVW